jgi:organic hydroperoxide reductase OsmC/OhrA
MMGTLATVLAGKKIPTFGDRFRADVEGDIEDVDGVLRITRMRVRYTMKVPAGKTEEAREALRTYITRCPGAMSVRGCIEITDGADITELPPADT